jgi:hypothetical protein
MNYFFPDSGSLRSSGVVLSLLKGPEIVSEFPNGGGYHPSPQALGHHQLQVFFTYKK